MVTQLPPRKKGAAQRRPQFLSHVCCGQIDRYIQMPLGREIGLSSCDIVLDGPELPPKKGHSPPPSRHFGSCLLWPNGWMHQYSTWYNGRPRPRRYCVRWDSSPLKSRLSAHVYCCQMVVHLSYCCSLVCCIL